MIPAVGAVMVILASPLLERSLLAWIATVSVIIGACLIPTVLGAV